MSDNADNNLDGVKAKMPYWAQFAALGLGKWWAALPKGDKMDVFVSVLAYILKLDFLDGYRSYIGGIGLVFTGLGAIFEFAGNPNATVAAAGLVGGVGTIFTGISKLGVAGKADKQIESTKAAAVIQMATTDIGPTPTNAEISRAVAVVQSPTLSMSSPVAPISTSEGSGPKV